MSFAQLLTHVRYAIVSDLNILDALQKAKVECRIWRDFRSVNDTSPLNVYVQVPQDEMWIVLNAHVNCMIMGTSFTFFTVRIIRNYHGDLTVYTEENLYRVPSPTATAFNLNLPMFVSPITDGNTLFGFPLRDFYILMPNDIFNVYGGIGTGTSGSTLTLLTLVFIRIPIAKGKVVVD